MADIELVIKIPEESYKNMKNQVNKRDYPDMQIGRAIAEGTPLQKGHGRIGDLDALRCENADFDTYNDYCIMFDEIEAAETIIGADKLENEKA